MLGQLRGDMATACTPTLARGRSRLQHRLGRNVNIITVSTMAESSRVGAAAGASTQTTSEPAEKNGSGSSSKLKIKGKRKSDEAAGASRAAAEEAPAPWIAPTVEFQRQKAKELTQFFQQETEDRLIEEQGSIDGGLQFGFNRPNEIMNGRYVMMGLFIGGLTEFATGYSFPEQIKLTLSVLGIADVYDY